MTNTTMINYSTRDFATKEQLELYLAAPGKRHSRSSNVHRSEEGLPRWNKEQSHRVGIVFEYRDQEAYKAVRHCLRNITCLPWKD